MGLLWLLCLACLGTLLPLLECWTVRESPLSFISHMCRFQQRAEARRQELLVQALAVDHEFEQELAEAAREIGVQLKAGWEASALRPILHKLADELVGFW